jgi:aspartate carbamoyltransferase regulatory subunit
MADCPTEGCENESLDTAENNDALAADEDNDYFCHWCGRLFSEEEVTA